ncbi:MAG: thioredoxin [Candidatus Methanomethylophilaceae archaeon]|jgi:thioredoxin 1
MNVIELTKENFEQEVMKSTKPVLIDFWASWCGPCRMIGPIVEEVANEATHAKVGKVNVDDQPELAQQFGISNIPTLVVMKDGKIVNKVVGGRPKAELVEMLNV